jgi:hypothetical protein
MGRYRSRATPWTVATACTPDSVACVISSDAFPGVPSGDVAMSQPNVKLPPPAEAEGEAEEAEDADAVYTRVLAGSAPVYVWLYHPCHVILSDLVTPRTTSADRHVADAAPVAGVTVHVADVMWVVSKMSTPRIVATIVDGSRATDALG